MEGVDDNDKEKEKKSLFSQWREGQEKHESRRILYINGVEGILFLVWWNHADERDINYSNNSNEDMIRYDGDGDDDGDDDNDNDNDNDDDDDNL